MDPSDHNPEPGSALLSLVTAESAGDAEEGAPPGPVEDTAGAPHEDASTSDSIIQVVGPEPPPEQAGSAGEMYGASGGVDESEADDDPSYVTSHSHATVSQLQQREVAIAEPTEGA